MPSWAACRCLFQLMRHCFLGRWTCLPVLESFRLVWKCHLFDYSTCIPFCVWWLVFCLWRLVPNYAVVFRLGWVYLPESLCHRRSRYRWLFLRGTFCFFSLSDRSRFFFISSIDVLSTYSRQMIKRYVPLQYSCYKVEVFCVCIRWTYFHFGVSIENRYCCDGLFLIRRMLVGFV